MKIALFAAVKEEVLNIKEKVHLTGIGRECATEAMLTFMQHHQNEDFTIMNIGTAGAHSVPVGSLIRVTEVVSGGAQFLNRPMLTDRLPIETPEAIDGYIEKVNVLDKAGAYAIQEHGDEIIEKIDGSLTNVIGLPVERLKETVEYLLKLPS